jgi:hypothetical protein
MSDDNEHLTPWTENEHESAPTQCGCLWRHEDYKGKKFPRCNYRKNAHEYSKGAEQHIYNVPTFRSPERWVEVWLDALGAHVYKRSKKLEKDSAPAGLKTNGVWTHGWDLDHGNNFKEWKDPYWHNTHHVIACGEVEASFTEAERKLLLKTRWNVHEIPNVIILPKQWAVARILKLPTHVPPDGKAEHEAYSTEIGVKLNAVKAKLAKKANQTGHELTDQTAPDARTELENASRAIRQFLINSGEKNPGINLDNLRLDAVNWS